MALLLIGSVRPHVRLHESQPPLFQVRHRHTECAKRSRIVRLIAHCFAEFFRAFSRPRERRLSPMYPRGKTLAPVVREWNGFVKTSPHPYLTTHAGLQPEPCSRETASSHGLNKTSGYSGRPPKLRQLSFGKALASAPPLQIDQRAAHSAGNIFGDSESTPSRVTAISCSGPTPRM